MDPTDWLPHRPPFLLVDDVELTGDGMGARGVWAPGPDRFEGHFPGRPLLPGVLQVESIAQVGAFALLASGVEGLPVFAGVDKVRWKRQVLPGNVLDLAVTLEAMRHGIGRGKGVALVDGDVACSATLLFALLDV